MRDIKRIISVLLIACMVFSFAGCKNQTQQTVDVTPLCEAFCADVKEGNATKLLSYMDPSETTKEELEQIIRPAGLNESQKAYLDAIRQLTVYTVQEPIYDYDSKTATVFLSWHQADYTSAGVMAAKDYTAFETALASAESKLITLKITVDFSGETQKISGAKNVVDVIYAFTSADNNVMPGKLKDYYLKSEFILAPERIYTNAKDIGIRLTFKKDVFGFRFIPGITYSVSRDDEVIYKSDVIELTEDVVRLDLTDEKAGASAYNEEGFLKAGIYTVKVEDDRGSEIVSLKCRVENKEYEKEQVSFKNLKNDYYLSNLVFDFKDNDMKDTTYLYNSGWWDYDKTSVGKSAFGSNTKTLGFSLAVNKDTTAELYYDYFYSKEADFKGIDQAKPLFSSSTKPKTYDDQSCYDLDYTAEKFEPGFYGLVVYSDASKKHIVCTAACIVVKEAANSVFKNN